MYNMTLSREKLFNYFVAFSYGLFFLFVPITKSISYLGWLLPIALFIGHISYKHGLSYIIKSIAKSPITYLFIYLIVLNAFNGVAFVKAQVEIKLLGYIMVMIATSYFLHHSIIQPRFLVICFSVVSLVLMIDGYWQYFVGIDFFLQRTYGSQITSAMEHWNSFGLVMFLLLVVLSYVFAETSGTFIIKMGLVLCIFGVFGIILFSGSRSIWLSTIVFFLLLFALKFRELNLKRLIPILVFIIIVIVIIIYHTPVLFARIEMMLQGNSSGRDLIWQYFIEKIPDQLLFGHGLTSPHYMLGGEFLYPHNLTIEILYSFGLIGLLSILWVTWKILVELYKSSTGNLKPYLLGSFIAIFGIQQQLETSILLHKVAGPLLFLYFSLLNHLIAQKEHL